MHKCEKHGKLDSEWCDKCRKIVKCDHSETAYAGWSDLFYDCSDGEHSTGISISFCATCGKPKAVKFS